MLKKLFIEIDEQDRVVKIFSDVFEEPNDGSIFLAEGDGDEYAHAHLYLEKPVFDFAYNYKYVDGELIERTDEEKNGDTVEKEPQPSEIELAKEEINSLREELELTNQYLTDLELLVFENIIQ